MQNPLTIIVFGVTGDLYQKKLSGAFFNLFSLRLLPADFSIVGFARKPFTDDEFQNFNKETILKKNPASNLEKLKEFLAHIKYVQSDDLENPESFEKLKKALPLGDKIFYLSVPPYLYSNIFKNISSVGLADPKSKFLIEKPFGKDKDDAENLQVLISGLFNESQIFRVDHYLAKKGLQDVLPFRFEGGELESFWNNKYIEKVHIVFNEENIVGARGPFYDGLGALLDVGQNHMLQMLALVAMDNPGILEGEKIRQARAEVLEKIVLPDNAKIVRGQYEGYLKEPGVSLDSHIETFFRVSLEVDNERWNGVPFVLEAGKALDKAEVFIKIDFKDKLEPKIFSIPPSKGETYDAYEKIVQNCILGDQTLFTSAREVTAEWKIAANIMQVLQSVPLSIYKKGSTPEDIGV